MRKDPPGSWQQSTTAAALKRRGPTKSNKRFANCTRRTEEETRPMLLLTFGKVKEKGFGNRYRAEIIDLLPCAGQFERPHTPTLRPETF